MKTYCLVLIKTSNVERFFLKCRGLGIVIFHTEKKPEGIVVKILEEDVKKLRKIWFIRYKVIDYLGVHAIKKKLKKNLVFLVALLVGLILLFVVSHVIIDVDVIHSNKEIRDLVTSALKDYGISKNTWRKSFKEIERIKEQILNDYPEKLESGNDMELAKFWASLGEVYVNDAFGSMHRAHASTAGIAKFLPHCIGLLVEEELNNLNILVRNTPQHFGVFMGGAKVDDKLPIIKSLLDRCDFLLTGGGIANSFLKAKGADVGGSIATSDEGILEELKSLMDKYKGKIILPVDFTIDDGIIYDIGSKSLELYKKYIDKSEIIFVNGTCGKFEDDRFTEGTSGLFKILKESNKKVIVGGGDTVSAAKKFGYTFSFMSSGGGATLEYIADGTLKALEWME